MAKFLSFEGDNAARLVNNLDWTAPMSAIDFLRDIGKHYRVGTMLKKDAVSARLNSDEGICYTEFSYQILQGLDFRQLYLDYGCVLQTGGSDQWGNLTSGVDLLHKAEGVSVHAIGTPLVTNSDGSKFGKSEGNAIWLDAAMCSPYAFYQFWLNSSDADVIGRLKIFTFLPRAEIERLEAAVRDEPFKREAQRRLAFEVTSTVHGVDADGFRDRRFRSPLRRRRPCGARRGNARRRHRRAAERRRAHAHPGRAGAGRHGSLGQPERRASRHRAGWGVPQQREGRWSRMPNSATSGLAGLIAVLRRGKKTAAGLRLR